MRMSAFQEACEQLGVRVTHQRIEIYREVASTEEHPDADAVYRGVRERIPTISLDTVYRNLKLLAGLGLISVVGTSEERLRFDGNMRPHRHFVCLRCGMIRDFSSSQLGDLRAPDEARAFGEPVSLNVEVKGICRECQSEAQRG